jgi:putative membrane protein
MSSEDSAQPRPDAAPRRLHPAGVVLEALGSVRQLVLPTLAAFVVTVGGGEDRLVDLPRATAWALALAGGSLVLGALSWRATTYWVADDALHVRRGVLRVSQTSLPLERVQSVDTVRGPVQRAFGVVELRVQAAGGGRQAEVVLEALPDGEASELRAVLARDGARPRPAEASVRRLGTRALLVAAATSGQLGVLLPVLAAAGQFGDELIRGGVGDQVRGLVPRTAPALLLALAVLAAAAWLLALAGAVVAFGRFRVTRDGDRLHIRRGLVRRRESTIPVARIHAVRVIEGILRQPFGLAYIRAESAGYAEEPPAAQTLFPLLRRREVTQFLCDLLPELADDLGSLAAPPARAVRPYVLGPLALALAAGAAGAALTPAGPAALFVVVPAAAWGWMRHRAAGWRLAEDRLVVRFRRLGRTTVVMGRGRLEERTLSQNPFQRRARLARFAVAVGSGARFSVAQLEEATGRELLRVLQPSRAAPSRPRPSAAEAEQR